MEKARARTTTLLLHASPLGTSAQRSPAPSPQPPPTVKRTGTQKNRTDQGKRPLKCARIYLQSRSKGMPTGGSISSAGDAAVAVVVVAAVELVAQCALLLSLPV
ncbi:hypothetical protein ZHAS_00019025 [Anopheles sinensis]|uniref:Uncharacterized protein n=1 Tax=Anopheles sinensis TaxID=74873 RepID=A0A084WL87_ANOSI|nr:hypothetical protein ZHAS_00019025 [Anopheles sinensis]